MSSSTIQLELFEENDELTILGKELDSLKKQNEKLKKSLFSKHNELSKLCLMLKEELDDVKRKLVILENKQLHAGKPTNSDMLETLFKEAYLGNA